MSQCYALANPNQCVHSVKSVEIRGGIFKANHYLFANLQASFFD